MNSSPPARPGKPGVQQTCPSPAERCIESTTSPFYHHHRNQNSETTSITLTDPDGHELSLSSGVDYLFNTEELIPMTAAEFSPPAFTLTAANLMQLQDTLQTQ